MKRAESSRPEVFGSPEAQKLCESDDILMGYFFLFVLFSILTAILLSVCKVRSLKQVVLYTFVANVVYLSLKQS